MLPNVIGSKPSKILINACFPGGGGVSVRVKVAGGGVPGLLPGGVSDAGVLSLKLKV